MPKRQPGNPGTNKITAHRRKLAAAMRQELSAERIATVLRKLFECVEAGGEGWIKAAEILLDRGFGKPKVEADINISGEISIAQREKLALSIMGFKAPVEQIEEFEADSKMIEGMSRKSLPAPEPIVEAEISEASRPGSISGEGGGAVPELPAKVHSGSGEVRGGGESSPDGHNLRTFVEVNQEASVQEPTASTNQ